jgi:pimeloyl-ACP methyl ester carboxylesterase
MTPFPFGEIRNSAGERIDSSAHPSTRNDTLVILGHGVTGNKDRPLLVALAQGLAERGWPCLRISFAGNGESEGNFSDSNITKGCADLQAVLDHLPHGLKVAYAGHSMGGAVGALAAARDERIHALLALAGMTHTAAFVAREFGEITPGAGCMWEDENCPLSQNFTDDLTAIGDTLSAITAVPQACFFIHGSADDVVPIQDGKDAYAAAEPPKQWLEIPGAGHSFDEASYSTIADAVDAWLQQVMA